MKFYKNLSVRIKLIISHGLIALMAVGVAIFGIVGIQLGAYRLQDMETGPLTAMDAAGDLMYATTDLQRIATAMILASEKAENSSELFTEMESDLAMMGTAMNTIYEAMSNNAEAISLIESIGAQIEASGPMRQQIVDAVQSRNPTEANKIYRQGYQMAINNIQHDALQLKEVVRQHAQSEYQTALATNNMVNIAMLTATVIALAIGIVLAIQVSSAIRKPVQQLVNASQQMQQGNLAVADEISYVSKDELGVLAASLRETMSILNSYVSEIGQTMRTIAGGNLKIQDNEITDFHGDFAVIKESMVYIIDNLNNTLSDIHIASEQVDSGANQVASGAQALSQGSTEQAAAVQQLAATLGEINGKVREAGQQANDARRNTEEELTVMTACDAQMKDMLAAMDEISRTSEEIGKINKTIEDIAFQTNILALNAAVEAARAGAAGKGFAVVADEVRSLAAKSAEASKNASDLIEASMTAVQKGVRIAGGTAENLQQVSDGANKNAKMVTAIAEASKALIASIEQISTGIDQISAVVQTNSATAEQSAAASEELSGQSAMLKELITQFHLR